VATLGKAFGVNGGYVVADDIIIRYLRETSPFSIYSNPITPAEAAAALKAIDAVDSPSGAALLRHLRLMITRFKAGLIRLGFETLPGEHPVTRTVWRRLNRLLPARLLTGALNRRGGSMFGADSEPIAPAALVAGVAMVRPSKPPSQSWMIV